MYSYNAKGNFVNFFISLSARSFRTAAAACLAQLHGLFSPVSQFFTRVVKKEVAFDIFPCCRICFDRYIPSLSPTPTPLSPWKPSSTSSVFVAADSGTLSANSKLFCFGDDRAVTHWFRLCLLLFGFQVSTWLPEIVWGLVAAEATVTRQDKINIIHQR